jgi:hypothetical protein
VLTDALPRNAVRLRFDSGSEVVKGDDEKAPQRRTVGLLQFVCSRPPSQTWKSGAGKLRKHVTSCVESF